LKFSQAKVLNYLEKNVLEPLEINNTMFWAQGNDADRLSQLYRPTDGRLVSYNIESIPFSKSRA